MDKFQTYAENFFDAILIDIRMPVMDGWVPDQTNGASAAISTADRKNFRKRKAVNQMMIYCFFGV